MVSLGTRLPVSYRKLSSVSGTHPTNYWPQATLTFAALLAHIESPTQQAVQSSDLNNVSGHWYNLVQAVNIYPEPLTVQRLQARLPYHAPKRLSEALQILTAHGFLRPAGAQQFVATERGKAAIDMVTQVQRRVFAGLTTLPDAALIHLRDLLARLAAAVDASDSVPHNSYDDARRRPITSDQPLIEQVARYLSALEQFRSDAHVAAWKAYHNDAIGIVTLTALWHEQAHCPESLEKALPYRGHAQRDYENALKRLVKLGWATVDEAGVYRISEVGRAVSERIEMQTNTHFFAPFAALNDAQRDELNMLLGALQAAIPAPRDTLST